MDYSQHVRPRPRAGTCTFVMLTMLVTMAATFLTAQLANAALSTVVQSDVPIVSERSMYWQEGDTSFGEGHNSTGVVSTTTRWGLAEGRVGGPREFVTYILLANPSATAADVSVTYLHEGVK